MKPNEWIQIAGAVATTLLAVATFAGPVVAARVSPKEANPPTSAGRRAERWSRRLLKSPWLQSPWRLYVPIIVLFIYLLIRDVHNTAPLTRGAVFSIALHVAEIVLVVVSILSSWMGAELISRDETERSLWGAIRTLLEIQSGLVEIDRQTNSALDKTARIEAVLDIQSSLSAMKEEIESLKKKSERRRR